MRLTGTPPAYLINRMPSHEVRPEQMKGVCRAGLHLQCLLLFKVICSHVAWGGQLTTCSAARFLYYMKTWGLDSAYSTPELWDWGEPGCELFLHRVPCCAVYQPTLYCTQPSRDSEAVSSGSTSLLFSLAWTPSNVSSSSTVLSGL